MAYGQASPTAFEAETRRLGFEKLSVERHLQDYHKIFSDPRTEAWTGHPPFTELSQSASKMEPTTYSPDRPWISNYALILKPSPTEEYPGPTEAPMMIGVAGVLRRIAMLNSEGVEQEYEMEIGYALHPDFTGKGYGVEAVQGFLDLYWSLPERENINSITAIVYSRNEPSWKLLVKLGAEKVEGGNKRRDMGIHPDANVWVLKRPVAA